MKLEEFIASQKGRHVRTADLLRAIAASVRDLNNPDRRQHPYAPRVERLAARLDALVATLEPHRVATKLSLRAEAAE